MSNINVPTLSPTSIPLRPHSLPLNQNGQLMYSKSAESSSSSCCDHKMLLEKSEEKVRTLSSMADNLRLQLEHKGRAHESDVKFCRNLLHTLNHRGYNSLIDHNGIVIDLGLCKGDCIYELKGKDNNLQQPFNIKPKIKKVWGNECFYKALIGNQERSIQNLHRQLEFYHEKKCEEDRQPKGDIEQGGGEKTATALEGELLQLMSLLEVTCQRYPEVFYALREQHQRNDKEKKNRSKSQRTIGSGSVSKNTTSSSETGTIVDKILENCKSKAMSLRPRSAHQVAQPTSPSLQKNHGKQDVNKPCPTDAEVIPAPAKLTLENGLNSETTTTGDTCDEKGIEVLDFEKFIGAAVLQLKRGRVGLTTPTDENKATFTTAGLASNTSSLTIRSKLGEKANLQDNKARNKGKSPKSGKTTTPTGESPRGNRLSPRSPVTTPNNNNAHSSAEGSCTTSTSLTKNSSSSLPTILMLTQRPHTTSNSIIRSNSCTPAITRPLSSSPQRTFPMHKMPSPRPRSIPLHPQQRPQVQLATVSLPLLNSARIVGGTTPRNIGKRNRPNYGHNNSDFHPTSPILRPRMDNIDVYSNRTGMSCPYCMQDFDRNMTPDDVRKHLERHSAF